MYLVCCWPGAWPGATGPAPSRHSSAQGDRSGDTAQAGRAPASGASAQYEPQAGRAHPPAGQHRSTAQASCRVQDRQQPVQAVYRVRAGLAQAPGRHTRYQRGHDPHRTGSRGDRGGSNAVRYLETTGRATVPRRES